MKTFCCVKADSLFSVKNVLSQSRFNQTGNDSYHAADSDWIAPNQLVAIPNASLVLWENLSSRFITFYYTFHFNNSLFPRLLTRCKLHKSEVFSTNTFNFFKYGIFRKRILLVFLETLNFFQEPWNVNKYLKFYWYICTQKKDSLNQICALLYRQRKVSLI